MTLTSTRPSDARSTGPHGGRRSGPWADRVWQLIAIAVAIVVWQLGSLASVVAAPLDTGLALIGLAVTGTFWAAVGMTLLAAALGLFLAAVVAIPLGLAVGARRFALASSRLTVDVLRAVPPVVLIPLVLLLFGPSLSMQVSLIILGAFWPMFIQASYGIREVDPTQSDMARAFKLGRFRTFFLVTLPGSMPFLTAGVRISSTIALLIAVAAELIGGAPGIGQQIGFAQLNGQTAETYAYVLVSALLGVAVNTGVSALQRALLFWHPSIRGASS